MEKWTARFGSKLLSVEAAVSKIKNGDRIFLGSRCTEPKSLIVALGASGLDDVEMVQFLGGAAAADLTGQYPGRFRLKTFFVGRDGKGAERPPEADAVPLFHSEIPSFFRNRRIAIDTAVVQVSEPDRFGRFSLGIGVDVALAAVESARSVIALVNPRMPRTLGDTFISSDKMTHLVEIDEELPETFEEVLGERERTISEYCCELITDGSIVHFGFAGISRGLMDVLSGHRDLGLHTEIFTDPLVDLIESGVVNNSTKKMFRGKSLATCCMGTRKMYDYVKDNSLVEFYPSDILLDPSFIASNDKMVSVNLALQVDLRGQIRQGSPTWTAFEGSGGDHDFMRGASMSKNGRSIVCLRSTSERTGRTTIVPSFGSNATVMMNRGEVNFVVTEYGIAYLGGRSVRQRAMALIEIAHPSHREHLYNEGRKVGYLYPDQFYYRMMSPDLRRRVRTERVFKGDLKARIRAIKSTDESMIRDLFYHLSERAVYFRYFSPRKSMPHANLTEYVNLPEDQGLSLVVLVGPREDRKIIAEARYLLDETGELGDVAFMVEGAYQGRGIGSFLLEYLTEIAIEQGVKGFQADVLVSNQPMLKVFEKTPYVKHRSVSGGVITLTWRFDEPKPHDAQAQ